MDFGQFTIIYVRQSVSEFMTPSFLYKDITKNTQYLFINKYRLKEL